MLKQSSGSAQVSRAFGALIYHRPAERAIHHCCVDYARMPTVYFVATLTE
jgi:hypothetical protein